MTFPYFINKTAPVSGVKSLLDYEVSFIGKIVDGKFKNTIKVVVPVTSLVRAQRKFQIMVRIIKDPMLRLRLKLTNSFG